MEIRETGARRFRIDIHFLTMERNASEVIEFRDILKHRSGQRGKSKSIRVRSRGNCRDVGETSGCRSLGIPRQSTPRVTAEVGRRSSVNGTCEDFGGQSSSLSSFRRRPCHLFSPLVSFTTTSGNQILGGERKRGIVHFPSPFCLEN